MSLIKRNVEELEDTVNINTKETLGSTAVVTLTLRRLIDGVEQQSEKDSEGRGGTAIIPPSPGIPEEQLPTLKACVYAPSSWMRRYDERDKRSIDLLHQSLSHTLGAWFRPIISAWQATDHENDQELPDLVFVTQHDVNIIRQVSGEKFKDVKTAVICADVEMYSELDSDKIKAAAFIADAIITGSVIPSKLWKTLSLLFPHIVPTNANTIAPSLDDLSTQDQDDEQAGLEASSTPEEQSVPTPAQTESRDYTEARSGGTISPHAEEISQESRAKTATGNELPEPQEHTPLEQLEVVSRPRVLLVDDIAVNIKVLSMFLKKNHIPVARQIFASGGQEAIDAFDRGFESDDTFDIIFMDLSMPEISGFDATATIRGMEKSSMTGKRAHTVALTGSVSDKDRAAAATVGVDDCVTKAAGLKNVQAVIKAWETNWKA